MSVYWKESRSGVLKQKVWEGKAPRPKVQQKESCRLCNSCRFRVQQPNWRYIYLRMLRMECNTCNKSPATIWANHGSPWHLPNQHVQNHQLILAVKCSSLQRMQVKPITKYDMLRRTHHEILNYTPRIKRSSPHGRCELLTYWGAGLHSLASGHCHLRIWQDLPFPFCFFPFSGSNFIFSHWCSGQESALIDRLLLVSLRTAAKVASMCGPPTHASCLPGWARLAIPGGNPPREVCESVSFLPCNFLTRPLKGAVCFWCITWILPSG